MSGTSTKDRILETSIELFSTRGFFGVSIRDIAKTVGIKESSIYNHFKSKEEILDTIFDQFQDAMEQTIPSDEALEKALGGLSAEDFWKVGLMKFTDKTETPRMENISKIILYEMFRNQRARDLAISELFTRQQDVVRKIFSLMIERGVIADLDVDALATAYSYAMLSLQLEMTLKKNWGLNTDVVLEKMMRHIRFISEVAGKIN